METMKVEILFVKHNQDFSKEICSHFTTIERLMTGKDKFPYNDVEIIAKRQFTGWRDMNGTEIYQGDNLLCHCDDGDTYHIGVVEWFKPWGGWAAMDGELPNAFGDHDSTVAEYQVDMLEVTGHKFKID